jgi:hypothetical protein
MRAASVGQSANTHEVIGIPAILGSSLPHIAPGAILQRLGHMWRGDRLAACQIGDGAGELKHAVEGAG